MEELKGLRILVAEAKRVSLKECQVCLEPITGKRLNCGSKYCSVACRKKDYAHSPKGLAVDRQKKRRRRERMRDA